MERPPLSLPERLVVLFAGFESQFGWLFFGFGMIFVWAFGAMEPVKDLFRKYDATATGTIVSQSATGASVNDQTVMRYDFTFQVNGRTYEGASFSQRHLGYGETQVTIEYASHNPAQARIQGARTSEFPLLVLIVVIFPLAGLIFILYSFRRNSKHLDLLNQGIFAHGKLLKKEPTNVRINNSPVYAYTFEFKANDGRVYQATGKTHLTHLLEDQETERVIYAPNDPAYATMYDSIPGAPELGPDGFFRPLPLHRYLTLLLPGLMLLLHGTIAYYHFKG